MKNHLLLFICALIMGLSTLQGQQTIGLFTYENSSFEGYSLYGPLGSPNTYLIDNCGRYIHSWTSQFNPGLSSYLLEDGKLLHTGRVPSGVFSGGGIGGRIELFSWEGDLLWAYNYANDSVHQHHDVEFLPNGNILILAWESRSRAEAMASGRNPNTLGADLWPTQIVEVEPIDSQEINIVWEWHLWDHLIQDFDSTAANFGVVADHPELMDLNFTNGGGGGPGGSTQDWIHANAIDYNEDLDQIAISSRNLNEVWIIDHSTTSAEAARHTGGKSGKGGDLLYRWGNPMVYGRGSQANQQLFGQHDVHWIEDSLPGAGQLMVYNNGQNRPGGNASSVDAFLPPLDSTGNYLLNPGQAFGPSSLSYTYMAPVPSDFYSSNISGAHRLPNGNTLICEGSSGHLFEVSPVGAVVWDYVNPIAAGGALNQGTVPSPGNNINVFRVHRYAPEYPGLQGRDLSPGDPLERNPLPLPAICDASTPIEQHIESNQELSFYPNPVQDMLYLKYTGNAARSFRVWDVMGKQWQAGALTEETSYLSTRNWPAGIYFLQLQGDQSPLKIIKL